MGLYNILKFNTSCASCGEPFEDQVQFKYGATRLYEYQLGEKITWGHNEVGTPNHGLVAVDGVSEGCINCVFEADYVIVLERDVLRSIEVNRGQYHFVKESFIVIKS